MSSYYYLHYCSDEAYERYGVAYAPPGTDIHVIPEPGQKIVDWQPLHFTLREGGFADYLADNIGARLCSVRLRRIVDKNLAADDRVQWLEATVAHGKEIRPYWILHFPEYIPVLDREKSIMVGSKIVVKPVLSAARLHGHNICSLCYGTRCFVSSRLKRMVEAAQCTGVGFSKVPVTGQLQPPTAEKVSG